MRSTYPSAAAYALLWTISAFPAVSQEVLGKTIQVKYSIKTCSTTKGFCTPVQTYHSNIYVGRQGHVYDYFDPPGSEKGKIYTLGVTDHDKSMVTTFTAEGNTLTLRSDISGGSTTFFFRIKENTCEVSNQSTFRNVRSRVTTLECTVTDGNAN
jgi:hypothetical protein